MLIRNLRLVFRLLFDRRVPAALKVLPAAALVYLVLPTDLVPDVLVGLGWVDDLVVIVLAFILFLGLCPRVLIEEHLKAMGYKSHPGGRSRGRRGNGKGGDSVEGSYHFIDDNH